MDITKKNGVYFIDSEIKNDEIKKINESDIDDSLVEKIDKFINLTNEGVNMDANDWELYKLYVFIEDKFDIKTIEEDMDEEVDSQLIGMKQLLYPKH